MSDKRKQFFVIGGIMSEESGDVSKKKWSVDSNLAKQNAPKIKTDEPLRKR